MPVNILQPHIQLKGHTAPILCVKHAKDSFLGNNILASGSEDSTCRLWDLRTNHVIKGIKNLQEPVSSVSFASNKDSSLFYLSSGNKVFTYDLRNTSIILTESIREYRFSSDEINSIDVNKDQTFLTTADDNGEVKVVDLQNHKIYKKLTKKHKNICMSSKFNTQKAWEVWSGGMDSKVYRWDFSKGSLIDIFDMASEQPSSSSQMFNPPFVYTLSTSPDGKWLIAGLGDTSLQLFDLTKTKKKGDDPLSIKLEDGHSNMVNCLSFLSSTKEYPLRIISGSANGGLSLWQLTKKQLFSDVKIEPYQKYQLDTSVVRLNSIEVLDLNDATQIAVGAVGPNSHPGTLNIYNI
ncbi:unnamed protein product [Cunninghamella echinulata]